VRRSVGPAIEIEVVGAGGVWPTMIDPHQLENALLNLCINARDAHAVRGPVTIETATNGWTERAAAEPRTADGAICVDLRHRHGTGMAAEVIARAFRPLLHHQPLGLGTGLGPP